MSGKPEWIYKSGGKFFYANSENLITEVHSQFAQNAEAVAQQSIEKNAWKSSSDFSLASDGRKVLSIIGGVSKTLLKTNGIADEVRWL